MKKIKNKKYLFLSFIIPIIILFLNLMILKIIYKNDNIFSSNQILVADLKSQYISLFNYLRNVLQGNDSIFYSFHNFFGGNMMGTYAYYLSSPLNFIFAFSSSSNIVYFVIFLILFKIGLSGLTMFIFLNHKKNNPKIALIFSLFYALMAYNVSYYFNIMWLDCVFLSPLILYGIDNIIHKFDGKLYLIVLSLTIFSNFYIAYMICIFSVIYFIYEMIISYTKKNKEKIIKCIKIFIFCSLLSGLICSCLLIPMVIDMKNIFRGPLNSSMYIQTNFFKNFLVAISKTFMLPQTPDNLLSSYTPNIYFGILPLLYVFTFFYGNHSNKEKYVTLIIIAFFFLSFTFNNLNIFWHGFTFPNGYAFRFSFLFSLFMILVSYKSIISNDKMNIHKLLLILFVLLFIGLNELNNGINISFSKFSLILTIILFILYYIFTRMKNKVGTLVLLLLVFIELLFHVNNSFFIVTNLGYEADYKYYLNTICKLSKKIKKENYRFSSPLMFGGLESFMCEDTRISGALTTNNANVYNFMYNMGFTVTYSTISSNDNTLVAYSLIGVKDYLNFEEEGNIKEIDYYYNKDTTQPYYLHDVKEALPIGYLIDSDSQYLFNNYDKDNAFEYQNSLIKSMSGLEKDVLISFDYEINDDSKYEVDISNGKDIYIYIKYPVPENEEFFSEITINDTDVLDLDTFKTGVFKLINNYEDDTLIVDVYNDERKYNDFDGQAYFYYVDEEAFEEHLDILRKNTLNITKKTKNILNGKIKTDHDGTLFLSIPYEKGWNIYVDGKKVDYEKLYDTFIGINLKAGTHTINMKYYSPGILIGFALTIFGISVAIIYFRVNKKSKRLKVTKK